MYLSNSLREEHVKTIAYTENDWHNAKPDWIRHNEDRGQYVDGPNEFSETEFKKRQAKTLTTVNAVIACRREA